jgi:hypothetical protein
MNPYTNDNEALPVPGVHPLSAPIVALQVNEAWIPYIVGALDRLTSPTYWEGTTEEVDDTLQQVDTLLASLGGQTPMSYFGPLFPLQSPVAADFSWVNQGSSTLTEANNGLYLTAAPGASPNLRVQVKPQPAKPYKIDARFSMGGRTAGAQVGGLCWRASGSGALITVGITNNNTLVIGRYSSPTVLSSNYLAIALSNFAVNGDFFVRLEDDNTNRLVSLSLDGEHWLQAHSIGNTDFLTADQVGFFASPSSGALPTGLWLQHWRES